MRLSESAMLLMIVLVGLSCDAPDPPPTGELPTASASNSVSAAASAARAYNGAAVDPDRPESCVRCHGRVVAEWNESMHARAHHSLDPIYAGIRKLRAKREGENVTRACATCHSPRDLENAGSPVAKMGVTCGTCHAVSKVKEGAPGALALVASRGTLLLGPHDIAEAKTPAHATGASPDFMKDPNRLCNACHQEMKSKAGIPICSTGVEHGAVTADAKRCVDCHMPMEQGPSGSAVARTSHRSHRFLGPHRAWYENDVSLLEGAVDMQVEFIAGKVTVTLDNKSQHAVPTGFPGRMAIVKVVGTKAGSPEVAYRSDDKIDGAVMRKIYVDEKGKPTLAPWAAELKSDRRLAVGEKRVLVFDVPRDIAQARVTLVFRLLPPPLAKKLGIADRIEAEPKVVIERVVSLER